MILKFILSILIAGASLFNATNTQAAQTKEETLNLKAADGVTLYAKYYQADHPKALILLFHQAGSNCAEYSNIAPRLIAEGYSALAIDQRSGGKRFGRDNETVRHFVKKAGYLDALPDLEAA